MLQLKGNYAGQARAASGMNIFLGIWLIISPWVFAFERLLSVTTSVFVGFLIVILAACRLAEFRLSIFLSAGRHGTLQHHHQRTILLLSWATRLHRALKARLMCFLLEPRSR
jgi:hypothetical protein